MEDDMVVKRKSGRPRRKPLIKEEKKMPIEQKAEEIEIKPVKEEAKQFADMYPDREPIYGEELSANSDPTELTKNGEPWNPREHGYETYLFDASNVDVMGMRGYEPVPLESGIRFKQHPLTDVNPWDKDFGGKVTISPIDNKVARRDMVGNEMADHMERREKYLKLNRLVLGIIPKEKAEARRKLAVEISNNSLRRDLSNADQEAQSEIGNSKFHGKFMLGQNASRSLVDKKQKSVKKVWSVPSQIK